MGRLSVLLTTEGSYPYHKGGVSTWCDVLTHQLREVDFTLLAVAMSPFVKPCYQLAPNVRDLLMVPLWGIEARRSIPGIAPFPSSSSRAGRRATR